MHVPSCKHYSTSLLYCYSLIDRSIESPVKIGVITSTAVEVGVIVVPVNMDTGSMIRGVIFVVTVYYYLS